MVISEQEGFIKGFVCENGRVDMVVELRPYEECRLQFNQNKPARGIKLEDYYRKKIKVTVEMYDG